VKSTKRTGLIVKAKTHLQEKTKAYKATTTPTSSKTTAYHYPVVAWTTTTISQMLATTSRPRLRTAQRLCQWTASYLAHKLKMLLVHSLSRRVGDSDLSMCSMQESRRK
jgi:hypothetical protein